MVEFPILNAQGLSTQRQVDALYSAPKHFDAKKIHKAIIKTGITVEYSIHTNYDTSDPQNADLPEEHLVLIMGFATQKEAWAPTIDLLVEKWKGHEQHKNLKILCFDNRGTGGSDAPWWRYTTSEMAEDTLALLDHVGWDSAHFVGISMGGMIALELASAASSRVKSLTLMVTTRGRYDPDPRSNELMKGMTKSKNPVVAAKYALKLLYSDAFLAKRMIDSGELLHDVLFKYHEAKAKTRKTASMKGLIGQLLAIKTHFVSDERLKAIKKAGYPILIVGSMKDILIPPVESDTLRKHLDAQHVQTLLFEDGGHAVNVQYAEEVVDGIMQTISRSLL